jgi:low affinity Fe/Cu permease
MDTKDAAEDRKKQDGRKPFERFVEAVNLRVSSAPFFLLMLLVIAGWLVSYPAWSSSKSWQYAIHTVSSVIALLLLVLLENAGRRAEEASQEKLNCLAEALSALMSSRAQDDPDLQESVEKLREAVGLEERH